MCEMDDKKKGNVGNEGNKLRKRGKGVTESKIRVIRNIELYPAKKRKAAERGD